MVIGDAAYLTSRRWAAAFAVVMDLLSGPFAAAAILLAAAGVPKIRTPLPTVRALRSVALPASRSAVRLLGAAEVVVGAAAVVWGGPVLAALVAVQYAGFAGFIVLALRRGGAVASCGCFGARDTPPTITHLVVNVTAVAVAVAAAALDVPGLAATLADGPWAGVPLLAATITCAWLAYIALTDLPAVTAARSAARPDRSGNRSTA